MTDARGHPITSEDTDFNYFISDNEVYFGSVTTIERDSAENDNST